MKSLRTGVTTGLCAAAASKAATVVLLSSAPIDHVEVTAKNGAVKCFEVTDISVEEGSVKCAVRKDAGDDPDITNGVRIFASVSKSGTHGIEVYGGEGVGRVTKPGLKVPVGKAAINPVPEEMILTEIAEVCGRFCYTGGIKAIISIPGGEEIANKTMNGRLGIVGGLSIIGTTGIVEPMSDRAIVETIKAEIDVQAASGKKSILMTPGNYGRDFARSALSMDIEYAVKCSNHIGEALDHASRSGLDTVTLIGHAGKLVKLAGGIMNTHSLIADCRMEIIASHSALAGARAETINQIIECVTVEAAADVLLDLGISDKVWQSIGKKIGFHLRERTHGAVRVDYIAFTLKHGVLIRGNTS